MQTRQTVMLPRPKTLAMLAKINSKESMRKRADRRPMREAMRWLDLITLIGSAVHPWVLDRVDALVSKGRAKK